MEVLIFIGLLSVAATNYWIAIQVRNQKTYNQIEVLPTELEYVQVPAPEVTIHNNIELDYEKLAEAIKQGNQPNPVFIPALSPPVLPPPTWQNPVVSQNDNVYDDGHTVTNDSKVDVYGTEIPVKIFPAR